jgi:hypothetical protein
VTTLIIAHGVVLKAQAMGKKQKYIEPRMWRLNMTYPIIKPLNMTKFDVYTDVTTLIVQSNTSVTD